MSGKIFFRKTETSVNERNTTITLEIVRTGSVVGDVTIIYGINGDAATEVLAVSLLSAIGGELIAPRTARISILDPAPLPAGEGDDVLTGGVGDDIYYVDTLLDLLTETPAAGASFVQLNATDWQVTPAGGGTAGVIHFANQPAPLPADYRFV